MAKYIKAISIRVIMLTAIFVLGIFSMPNAAAQSKNADEFTLFSENYAVQYPDFVKDIRKAGISAHNYKELDYLNYPERFITILEIWKRHFPEKSNFYAMYPKSWYEGLTQEQKNQLNALRVKRVRYYDKVDFLPLTDNEQITTEEGDYADDVVKDKSDLHKFCNSSNYKEHWWIVQRHANFGMQLDGNVSYQYLENPDRNSNETRIYDGEFRFWNSKTKGVHRLEGNFKSDRQVGRWVAKLDNYYITVDFNDEGQIEGEFTIYKNKSVRNEEKLVYSGVISDGYVTRLNYDGEFYGRFHSRPIKINGGRYGSGNGHPAGRWLIKVGGETDYRSDDKFFSLIPSGDYMITFAKYPNGYKLYDEWGDNDNWDKTDESKVSIIDEATGKRIDAGETITEIPRMICDDVVDMLNCLVLRKSVRLKYPYTKSKHY
ncbi:MAG: hypothetical protein NC548_53655 [Lachnospiraceae bacterium]|nr:hypothetical protein [Lachnospiraceae bacterium]